MAGVGNRGGGGGGSGAVRAGRAFIEVFADDTKVARAIGNLRRRFERFGSTLVKAGGLLGAGGAAALAPLKAVTDALGDRSQLAAVASAFGLTAEKASELFGVMRASGSDLRDATEGVVTFNQRIDDALSGKGEEAAELFKGLGRGADTFSGDTADRFFQLLDALRQVPDPAKRVQLLLKAVGEDTGKNLIPVLSMSADQLDEMRKAYSLTADELRAGAESQRQLTLASAAANRVWAEFVTALAPAIKQAAELFREYAKPLAEIAGRNKEVILTGLGVAGAVTVVGGAMVALGVAVKALAAVVLTPFALVTAAVGGLGYLFATQTEAGRAFAASVGAGFRELGAVAVESWGGIAAALRAGDFQGAWDVLLAGLGVAWAMMVNKLERAWVGFKMTFLDGFESAVADVQRSIVTMVATVAVVLTRQFGQVFRQLAGLASAAGLTDMAGTLRALDAIGTATNEELARGFAALDARDEAARMERIRRRMAEIVESDRGVGRARDGLAEAVRRAREGEAAGVFGGAVGSGAQAIMDLMRRGGAVAAAATGSSAGSFSALNAVQRFGGDRVVKERLKGIEANTAATVKAAEGIARALTFK